MGIGYFLQGGKIVVRGCISLAIPHMLLKDVNVFQGGNYTSIGCASLL